MLNLFKDIFNFIKFKKNEKNINIGFFSENNFIYEYLEPYIINKLRRHKIIIISFEDLTKNYLENSDTEARSVMQNIISESGMSSHMHIICKKN